MKEEVEHRGKENRMNQVELRQRVNLIQLNMFWDDPCPTLYSARYLGSETVQQEILPQ